jgi:hypothetical protein
MRGGHRQIVDRLLRKLAWDRIPPYTGAMQELTEAEVSRGLGRMKAFQFTVLAAVAAVAFWVYLEVGAIARAEEAMTHLVGIASRQVVLSQRIAGLCVELASHTSLKLQTADPNQLPDQGGDDAKALTAEQAVDKTRDDLRQSVALMEMGHQALINGSDDLKLTKPTATGINKVYYSEPYRLDHQVVYFLAAANAVADMPPAELNGETPALGDVQLAARESLITAENAAVSAYENDGIQ